MALHFVRTSDKKSLSDEGYDKNVKEYFQEMMKTGVLEEVEEEDLENENCYYLAWFSVRTGTGVNDQGKFRLVFNASGKINGLSLNDCLTKSPEITSSILNAAYAFRERKFVVTSDIKKMFFQFEIPEEQRNYLRILVHKDFDITKPLIVLRFARIAFGVRQASTMASLGVKLCARDNTANVSPETLYAVLNQLMVDDFVHTTDTAAEAAKTGLELVKLGKTCNLNF